MKVLKKIGKVLLAIVLLIACIAVIGLNYKTVLAGHKIKDIVDSAKSVEDIDIPDNVKIVGVGEATHGSVEFQNLKLEIFKMLVENKGFTAFCLEADFGDCIEANNYIQGGDGTAREIVNNMAFTIYHTQQMADILDWMREYNSSVTEDKHLRFYGFDMQNPEKCVNELYSYMKSNNITGIDVSGIDYFVDEKRSEAMTSADKEQVKKELTEIKKAIESVSSGDNDFDKNCALHLVDNIETSVNYVSLSFQDKYAERDQKMADNVSWILEQEKTIGTGKIMLAAHDGHVAKKGQSMYMTITMGGALKEKYGEGYYSLGTDFFKGMSNVSVSRAISDTYQRKDFYVTTADPIAYQAKYVNDKRFYLDFESTAGKENKKVCDLIHSSISMGSVGEGFTELYYLFHSAYRVEMAPAELYDGMIFYYKVGPTSPQY